MKISLTNTSRMLATAALGTSLLAAMPAFADNATDDLNKAELKSLDSGKTYDTDKKMPMMDKGVEGRIKHLHDQLKVTPDQEQDWAKVAQVMRDNATSMKAAFEAREASANLTAPDDIKAYEKTVQAHADALDKFESAFSTFYGKLTPEQQKQADKVFTRIADDQHEGKKKHG